MSDHLPFELPPDGHYARGSLGASVNGFLDTLQQSGYAGANHQVVRDQADLPDPSGGTITLDGSTVYAPKGIVSTDTPLDWTDSPVFLGRHGSKDGFQYTGTGALLRGTGDFFAEHVYFSAPGQQVLDLEGSATDEFYINDVTFSDPQGLGDFAWGRVEGYRVPSMGKCNVEDIDEGLTFDENSDGHSPNKLFLFGCPIREISASGVDIFTIPESAAIEFVDHTSSFVKNVQSDTTVWRVHSSSKPSGVLQVRGTLHDGTVGLSNVIQDESGTDLRTDPAVKVFGSFPMADTDVGGGMDLSAGGTVTGSGAGPTRIGSQTVTTTGVSLERMTQVANGQLRYDARFNSNVKVDASIGVSGDNTTFSVYIGKNGSALTGTESRGFLSNGNDAQTIPIAAKIDMTETDTLSVFLENTGGSVDLTVESFNVAV